MAPHATGDTRLRGAPDTFPTFVWLADDPRPLDWNGPVDRPFTRVRDQDLQRPIIEHFERIARRQRGRIAVRDANTALTFGELWDAVSGLAETLAAETKPGDLIGILLPACPMFPRRDARLPRLGTPVRRTRYTQSAGLARSRAAGHAPSADHHTGGRLPERRPQCRGPDAIAARHPSDGLAQTPRAEGWRPATMGVDEPACVLFTSGSTGRPKSIVNSQRNLLQRVAQSINAAHINAADRLLTLASPSTIVGVRDVLTALLAGASVHLLDPQGIGAREILTAIRAEASTILFAFPALLRSIVAARDGHAVASLRLVRVGGDTTVWSDIETLRTWLSTRGRNPARLRRDRSADDAVVRGRRVQARGRPHPDWLSAARQPSRVDRRRGWCDAAGRSRRARRRQPIRVAGRLGRG